MKKYRWVSIHNFFRIGLLFYTLFFFLLSAVSNIGITHAAHGRCVFLCTPTPTPTLTPTPTPTPTLTPTPTPTPTSTPTPTPDVQPTPTPVVPLLTTPTPVPITPTPTLESATATMLTVSPTQDATTKTNTISVNQQSQGARDNGGINVVVLSLSIAIPVLLVTGGTIWLLWGRQASQNKPATQGMYNNAQASWVNNYGMSPNPNSFQYAPSTGFSPDMSGTAPRMAGMSEVPTALASGMSGSMPAFGGGAQQMPSPQLTYTPSDFRPITAAFSQQMPTGSLDSGVRPAQNGDLLSQPMDTFSLSPQSARAKDGSWNEHKATGPIAALQPLRDTPIPFKSSPLPVPPVSLWADRPPSVKEDSMLEETMRQAQIGLFALLGR